MKFPPEVVYTGLKRLVGNPADVSVRTKEGNFDNSSLNLEIPVRETDQRQAQRFDEPEQ